MWTYLVIWNWVFHLTCVRLTYLYNRDNQSINVSSFSYPKAILSVPLSRINLPPLQWLSSHPCEFIFSFESEIFHLRLIYPPDRDVSVFSFEIDVLFSLIWIPIIDMIILLMLMCFRIWNLRVFSFLQG